MQTTVDTVTDLPDIDLLPAQAEAPVVPSALMYVPQASLRYVTSGYGIWWSDWGSQFFPWHGPLSPQFLSQGAMAR